MRHRRSHLFLAAGALAAVVTGVWLLVLHGPPREVGVASALDAERDAGLEHPLDAGREPAARVKEGRSPAAPAGPTPGGEAVARDDSEGDGDPGPARLLAELQPLLRHSLETTLDGLLDPEVFLAAALELVQLDVDRAAIPEPDPTGALRFRILGLPEGMASELHVSRTNNRAFAPHVLTLRIEVAPPEEETYVLGGLARKAPHARLTFWTDREGRPSHFGIYTNLDPDPRACRDLGLSIDAGVLPWGMYYSANLHDPAKTKLSMHGFTHGQPGELTQQAHLTGSEPAMHELEHLASAMQAMYAKIQD